MARNVELKAIDPDPERTLRAALEAGAEDRGVIAQKDTYFDVPRGRLKLRQQRPGHQELIAYQRADDPEVRLSVYHRLPVVDPAAVLTGLEAVCGVLAVVEKRRRLLIWEGVRIHIDKVRDLGTFVELEAVAGATSDLSEENRKVAHLRELLEITDDRLQVGSYADALVPAERANAEPAAAEPEPAGPEPAGAEPDPELLVAARAVAANAYAPYSKLHIGAAIRTDDGRRFTGANVENAAYPQGQCAEASAIGAMVAGGGRRIAEVVVASEAGVAPCGGCRQRLSEFAGPEARVYLVDFTGIRRATTMGELLPLAFDQGDLP